MEDDIEVYEDYVYVEEYIDNEPGISEEDKEEFMEHFYASIRNASLDDEDDED